MKKQSGIEHCQNASFTVVDHTQLLPQQFATLYMSGIAYGTIGIVKDEAEKRKGIEAILRKYASDYMERGKKQNEQEYFYTDTDKINALFQ